MTLNDEWISMALETLRKNQELMREDYSKQIDALNVKVDKILEKIDALPTQFVTRVEFDNAKEKIHAMEDKWNKIMWIIITAVIGAVLSLVLIHNP